VVRARAVETVRGWLSLAELQKCSIRWEGVRGGRSAAAFRRLFREGSALLRTRVQTGPETCRGTEGETFCAPRSSPGFKISLESHCHVLPFWPSTFSIRPSIRRFSHVALSGSLKYLVGDHFHGAEFASAI